MATEARLFRREDVFGTISGFHFELECLPVCGPLLEHKPAARARGTQGEMSNKGNEMIRVLIATTCLVFWWAAMPLCPSSVCAADPARQSPAEGPPSSTDRPAKLKEKGFTRIATIGPAYPVARESDEPQEIVAAMIGHWKGKFAKVLPDKPDLIVVPEVCDIPAGISAEKRLAYLKVRKDQVLDYFARVASENSCYVVYSSTREMADGTWRNTSVMLDRTGSIAGIYNKNHLVIGENTNDGVLYGREAPILECDFGRVAFAICFDLNFDELREKYVEARPDLIVFTSMYHGGLMQAYWAYSCRAHFVGAVAHCPARSAIPRGMSWPPARITSTMWSPRSTSIVVWRTWTITGIV